MNSGELASLAGVTVRTLRHYHQVGVLDEPPRGPNGYRRYGVHDLIRVLRIRRLAALGVPLEQVPGLLEDEGGAAALLDRLDAEVAARIERLTAQRELIAQLRVLQTPPDIPPELARFYGALAAASTPHLSRFDRDQTVLLAHLVGAGGMPQLIGFYERLADPALLPAVTETTARFDRLGAETTAAELDGFVDDFVATYGSAVEAFGVDVPQLDLSGSAELFAEYTESVLNSTQQRALELIAVRLEARQAVSARSDPGARGRLP